jgi:cytochrome c oxidase cbb3-type subunit I
MTPKSKTNIDDATERAKAFHTSEIMDDTELRIKIDESVTSQTAIYFATSLFWLLLGSIFGLIASYKMHWPDWLGEYAVLTFGRIRPAHLNTVAYGWISLAGAGTLLWMTSRLTRVPIRWGWMLYISALLWNIGVAVGTAAVLFGYSRGMEWLEFPRIAGSIIALGFVFFALPILKTFVSRKVNHVYVSLWYILASVVWFPLLYLSANFGHYQGVVEAGMNWWYGHNLLTVWVTPIGLAIAYYFLPKVIGRPIYSYYLSLLGFWSFALFYNWNGIHHLIGGPLPTWLVTISIVASVMMVIPVLAVAVNHHMTTFKHFNMLKYSPTLRFTVFGAMSYTAVSLQGSAMALRSINEVTHFTHYTVGHAHLGVYAFSTMLLFGAIYYIMPRLSKWEWPFPSLVKLHFWLTAFGVIIYVVALTIGGWYQGLDMNNPDKDFMESVFTTIPYLYLRSIGGTMMVAGHIIFMYHFALMIKRAGPRRFAPPWFGKPGEEAAV